MSQTDSFAPLMDRPPFYLTLHENLRHHMLTQPDKVAMIYEDQRYTFRQVYEQACQIARALRERGVGQGDNIGIFLRNCGAYIPIYYALSMAGGVAVPLNYMLRSEQLANLLDKTDCKFLFVESVLYKEVKGIDSFAADAARVCFVDDAPEGSGELLDDWLTTDTPCDAPAVQVSINDPMMILFSSGTTGLPKGIVLSHFNRVLYFFAMGMEYGIRYDDVNLCTTPLYHNAAIFFAFNNIYFGASTVVHRKFDILRTFRDIEKYGVTNTLFVPTQLHRIIESNQRTAFDLSSLRMIASAAAPLSTPTKAAILEFFPGVELHELYGLTETGAITSLRPADQLRKVRCAGQAFLNMEFRVVDPDANELPAGEVGEIVARGPTLFEGYYGDEEATRAAWREGWFHTGDLGKIDEEGFLYVVDRLKDMIISGGVNIYPKDVENAIYGLSEVRDVAVIGIPNETWGEVVHAVIVRREGCELTSGEVIALCEASLPAYQVPRSVEFRDELPRNPSGKLLKRVLREEFWRDCRTGSP